MPIPRVMEFDFTDPMLTVRPSPARHYFGVGVQAALGLLLLYVAFATPPADITWQVFLLVIGVGALLTAGRAWTAANGAVVLRADGLFDAQGRTIARLDEITNVDRAVFSFKPSNGFLIRMNTRQERAWVPGMWWRFGKRVGIGGVLPGAQAKLIADTLSAMIDARDEGRP